MHIFKKLIPVEEAQRILISYTREVEECEEVDIDNALGRVVAEDIYAGIDIPGFDRATRDGYAVIAEDTYAASERTPIKLQLRGYIKTGSYPKNILTHGEAFRIDTGAPLPRGANAVVPIEYTSEENGYVIIFRRVSPWANIQWAGADIARGEIIVQRGTIITPRHIGALAGIGYSKIKVRRKPKVAVFSIGDELISVDSELTPGKIYDINIHTLTSLIRKSGGEPVVLGIAKDNTESILKKLKEGLEVADIIISSGGSSVGQSDFIRAAVEELRAEVLFHGVMSKPGKPVLGSRIGDKLYIGLPGNPASAILSFILYVKPVISKMLGIKPTHRAPRGIVLRRREYGVKGRRLYKTIAIKRRNGDYVYESLPASSESISTLSKADAYFIIPEDTEFIDSGITVNLSFFDAQPQLAGIFIVGEYSPSILRSIISVIGDKYLVRYIRRDYEATLLAVEEGVADIAIFTKEVKNSIRLTRKIALAGDTSRGDIVTAMRNIEGERIIVVGSHQSAILRYLNGLAEAVIAPKELLDLYGIEGYRVIGQEPLYIYASRDLSEIIRKVLKNLSNL